MKTFDATRPHKSAQQFDQVLGTSVSFLVEYDAAIKAVFSSFELDNEISEAEEQLLLIGQSAHAHYAEYLAVEDQLKEMQFLKGLQDRIAQRILEFSHIHSEIRQDWCALNASLLLSKQRAKDTGAEWSQRLHALS